MSVLPKGGGRREPGRSNGAQSPGAITPGGLSRKAGYTASTPVTSGTLRFRIRSIPA